MLTSAFYGPAHAALPDCLPAGVTPRWRNSEATDSRGRPAQMRLAGPSDEMAPGAMWGVDFLMNFVAAQDWYAPPSAEARKTTNLLALFVALVSV